MFRFQTLARQTSALGSALAFAATLLAPTLAPTTPALADDPIIRDHRTAARLEVVINRVHIFDDHDWGAGEIRLKLAMLQYRECPVSERGSLDFCWDVIGQGTIGFTANSGDTVELNRVFPGDGDEIAIPASGPGIGFPVHAGPGYLFSIGGTELDSFSDDNLGGLSREIREQDGWGPLGAYDERGTLCQMTGFLHHRSDCSTPAAFSVDYEIRRTPLPDLQPTAFRVAAEAPTTVRDDQICFTVQNTGPLASDPFHVSIGVEDAMPPMLDVGAFGLAPGETREQCTSMNLPDAGSHQVSVAVDQANTIAEMDESNNLFEQVLARSPAPAPSPMPAPSPGPTGPIPVAGQARTELAVSAVKVNGQVPDGKNDCKDGKSDVVIVVKNGGKEKADAVLVRLSVDGAEAGNQSVKGLAAGQEREVRFEDIRLKKGEHTLTATAAPKDTAAEARADNNTLAVTAACTAANSPA